MPDWTFLEWLGAVAAVATIIGTIVAVIALMRNKTSDGSGEEVQQPNEAPSEEPAHTQTASHGSFNVGRDVYGGINIGDKSDGDR